MKILSVITSTDPKDGGPPEVLKNQVEFINRNKKKIYILSTNKIKISYLFGYYFNLNKRKKIKNFIKQFDIVHFHEAWNIKNILIAKICEKLMCKYLFVGHGYFDQWSLKQNFFKKFFFHQLFLKKVLDKSSAMFFSSKEEYLEARNFYNFKNVFIIPNGINTKVFKNLNKGKKNKIVFFGRIHKKKGVENLIYAVSELKNDLLDKYYFEICGPGEKKYINKIENLIKKSDLKDILILKNFVSRENKIKYLSDSKIFILPSYEEGDSIALKEALSLSIPVIVSKQCRMKIVQEYNCGLEIENNVEKLKRAILDIIEMDLEKMGKNARDLIIKKYENEDCIKRVYSIYENIHCGSKTSKDWY